MIAFSETDDVFNFWPDSATVFTGSDPFTLTTTSELFSPLEWMIAIQENVYAFSATGQFLCRAGGDAGVMTGLTAEVLRLSNLEMNELVRPKLAGAQILFCTDHYGYTHVREFSFAEQATRARSLNLGGSNDITLNIPKYMKGLVKCWDVGESVDTACLVDPENRRRVYVYKYLWAGSANQVQKVQQSWSTWEFAYDIQWVKFMDNILHVVCTTPEGTFFCTLSPQESQGLAVGMEPTVHLDRRIERPTPPFIPPTGQVTASYDSATDRTTFTLPYTPVSEVFAVVKYDNDRYKGLLLGSTSTKTLLCSERGTGVQTRSASGRSTSSAMNSPRPSCLTRTKTRPGSLASCMAEPRYCVGKLITSTPESIG